MIYKTTYFFLSFSNIEYPIMVSTRNNIPIIKDQKNKQFLQFVLLTNIEDKDKINLFQQLR